ncbi:MAG: hypothetical protein HKM89_00710 [Gemmatimonadales bacterium]|nr:hypothetical protein [Gemmatimonadales bacterium]
MTSIEAERLYGQVKVSGGVARHHRDGAERTRDFVLKELPEKFVKWQLDYKHQVYDAIERNDYVAFNAGHLPVVGTTNEDGMVANLANKGVGFTPKDEWLEHYLELVEKAVDEIQALPNTAVNQTRQLRIDTARQFYANPEHIDWTRLGLLEIFEGETFKNLSRHPFASVLWTGTSPVFLSFQVDCVVEIIPPEHPRYRFSWAMRRLFEYEPFHIVQTMFPYAYTFWVYDWHDKTPKRRYQ